MVSSVYIVALWIQRTGEFECCTPGKAFASRTNLMILTPHEETQPQPADRRCIVSRQLGGLWEGQLVGFADGALRRGDQVDEVSLSGLVGARAGELVARVAPAVHGEQHGVAQPLLGGLGVAVPGGGVVPIVDQQDRGLGTGIPRAGVAVVAAGRPVRRARRPQPPPQHRSPEPAGVGEGVDHLRPGRGGLGGGTVQAGDRHRLRDLAVDHGGLYLPRRGLQGRGVTVGGRVQVLRELRPCVRLPQRRVGGGEQVAVAELAGWVGVRCGDRRLARRGEDPRDALLDGLAVAGERTAVWAGALAEREELVEDLVGERDAVDRPRLGAGGVCDRIDDAVEQHRPHPVREQVGVGLAEHRPVGQADVGELAVPDGLAQRVQVAGGVRGRDVVEKIPVHLTAPARELDGLALVGLRLGRGHGNGHARPELVPFGVAAEAGHRRACAGAPRIPTHHVEAAPAPLVEVRSSFPDHRDAALTRSARVEECGPDALLRPTGEMAGTARSMCSPLGRSQSNGTESFPHCNWSSSANGGSQLVHAMPATSGAAVPGDGPACAVLTAPTADIATPHTATTTDRMIARGRGLPLAPLLAITHHPSAGRAPRERLPSHLDVPEDTPTLLTALPVAERLRRATGVGARAASARAQAIPVLRRSGQDTDVKVLAADTRISLATGYRYLHEGIDALAARAPDLHQVLERGKAGGWTHVTLEGTLRASASRSADAR